MDNIQKGLNLEEMSKQAWRRKEVHGLNPEMIDHVIDSCLKLLSILKVAYKAKRRLALALHPAL